MKVCLHSRNTLQITFQFDDFFFPGFYRSHSCVLNVPSKLFYEAELIPEAINEIQNRFLHLKILPNPDQPLIFHGVRGPNFQEGDSPSWFNPTEALQVSHYIRELLNECKLSQFKFDFIFVPFETFVSVKIVNCGSSDKFKGIFK